MKNTRSHIIKTLLVLILIASFIISPLLIINGHCGGAMDTITELRGIERDSVQVDVQSNDYFGYIKGSIPIVISAPHGAKHFRARENRWKAQDSYTVALAIKLGRLTGAHVIYTKNKTLEDPNNALNCRYKKFLAQVVRDNNIKFIMDLHGAGHSNAFKVDVGILDAAAGKSSCPTYQPIIERDLRDFEKVVFNKHFRARDAATITCYSWKRLGVESAQFEVNADYRNVGRSGAFSRVDADRVNEIIGRLAQVISDINKKISLQNRQTMGSGGPASCVGDDLSIRKPQSTLPNMYRPKTIPPRIIAVSQRLYRYWKYSSPSPTFCR